MRAATLERIGKNLEAAREIAGVSARDVVASMTPHAGISSWYAWVSGKREAGCQLLAQMAAFLNVRPDVLLMDSIDEFAQQDDAFTEQDRVNFEQIKLLLQRLSRVSRGKRRPCEIVLHTLREVAESVSGLHADTVPPMTVVAAPNETMGHGVRVSRTYAPPPASDSDSASMERVSEDESGYGAPNPLAEAAAKRIRDAATPEQLEQAKAILARRKKKAASRPK